MMTAQTISIALRSYLLARIQAGSRARNFFRLDGFSEATYINLLKLLRADENQLAGQPLLIRTTAPIDGYHQYALEADKSATWYRNNVPSGYALILIFNQRTSDAQSLKDIYPITENLLATEGIKHLIEAAFSDYQIEAPQTKTITTFLQRVRSKLFPPQLRDLVIFLHELNRYMREHPGAAIEKAIAVSLPPLGFFHCSELADKLNGSAGDRLLADVFRAAQLGNELLDESQQKTYLTRLERCFAEGLFADDQPYGGHSPQEKYKLLYRFVTNVIANRQELVDVLRLDWREVAPVLHKTVRKTREEKLKELAAALDATLDEQAIGEETLSDLAQDALQDLRQGNPPDEEGLDSLFDEQGDSLPRSLKNQLRRLRGARKRESSDFIAGLTHLAVQMLSPLPREELEGTKLAVTFNERQLKEIKNKEAEALLAFRTLYGGLEKVMPDVQWNTRSLWELTQQNADLVGEEAEEEGDQEKDVKVDLVFQVSVLDKENNQTNWAELIWQYRSNGPVGATLAHVQAEAKQLPSAAVGPLFQNANQRLRIPIYNNCPDAEDIGDLDLSQPIKSLGTWYHDHELITDLGVKLQKELRPQTRPEAWANIETSLRQLESEWARFVAETSQQGVLAADLDELLAAYQRFLETATSNLQQGLEALHGFRILTQGWIIGPAFFDEWVVVPFLHPLKLHWWRERAIQFNAFIARLLDPLDEALIVNEQRFLRELDTSYGSAGYPALLALPGQSRHPEYFLPVHEIDGYELYRRMEQASLAYGLDPELVSDDESKRTVRTSASELARVVQDYIETYPFVQDGLEIYLMQCRNGALPGLLVERLHNQNLHLNVIVHSSDRGASLYERVTNWLKAKEALASRPPAAYFPPITLKVLQSSYDELFQQLDDTDIVILPDVLAEKGQSIQSDTRPLSATLSLSGYLPAYRVQQAPYQRGEFTRDILLTSPAQPALLQQFYNLQWAAHEQKPILPENATEFRLRVSLQDWVGELDKLHQHFNWVVCYDATVDRFLLETTLPHTVEVIRYSLGLGVKNRHNLTVSSSRRAQDIVVRRLTANLESLLPNAPHAFRQDVARCLVSKAKQVSGDIVLRAAGPGAYLNELIGMVAAIYLTEKRYLDEHPGALTAWIYLDDFAHWFDKRIPDLLFVAIPPEANGELPIHIELLETKAVGEGNFSVEAADAQKQVAQGINRLAQAWAAGAEHLDAPYWYYQFYQAVVGNLAVHQSQRRLWESFRNRLPQGDFTLGISGHTWVFCHDGSAGIVGTSTTGEAAHKAQDVPQVPHQYYYFSRTGLLRVLQALIEDEEQLDIPADVWPTTPDEPPIVEAISKLVDETPVDDSGQVPVSITRAETPPEEMEPKTTLPSTAERDTLGDWLSQKASELTHALRDYEIRVRPIELDKVDIGPSIVRFKIELYPGEKGNRLQGIASDLQRVLALNAVPLINNVSGTRYIGVDLPHPQPTPVPLLPELDQLPQATTGQLYLAIGKTPDGQMHTIDLAALPHMLVAGSTGAGKTIFLYDLILSLIHQYGPESLSLLLIDPKQTDFVYFEDLPHLVGGQVVIEPEDAITHLEQLAAETIRERTQQLREARSRDIQDYNTRHTHNPMKPIVVVIDEYADLIQVLDRTERQTFERQIVRLAQRARNVGIHLVVATQRPTGDIVTTNLKTNLPGRVAFRLPSYHDSMTILDQTGAENLLGRGDMLFRQSSSESIRLQAPYIDTETLQDYLERFNT